MTRPMTSVQVRQRILDEYQLLIDFDGSPPTSVPAATADGENESWKSWCMRVLGADVSNVRVYLAATEIRGQTKLKTLVKDGPAQSVKAMIKSGKLDAKARALRKQTLAAERAETAAEVLRREQRRTTTKIKSLQAADAASGLQSFADDLDTRLTEKANAPASLALDELVLRRAQTLLANAKDGTPMIDLVWDLLQFSSDCRKAVRNTAPPPPPPLNGG